ncbi:DUF2790 domain-containing protein [Zestomonas thermotolerans]|jgi:hypothetical protein|uniref:DUF2790 domain-containing protein n=1 Tax=Zestomonas thermotolerans TaxID=157784 RepID=UPI000487AEBC|nr:DUF2790 domain-containing protein [Pseudomonas thermotolerans]
MLKQATFLTLSLLATSAMADGSDARDDSDQLPQHPYQYGMQLDVQKVISVTPRPQSCDVAPATMIYVDSHGDTQRLDYLVMGDCLGS